ncbi:nucleoside phosphatase family-domain-containing protein [Aspergillus crustosus]
MGKWHYGIVLDAGSSGTRVHVYRWLDNAVARKKSGHDLKSLPEIKTKANWVKKIRPGVSSFAERPEEIGPEHLAELLEFAREIVPDDAIKETPIFLLATAGMRLVEDVKQNLLLDHICSYARENFDFALPDCNLHIQVIPGVTEGLYGWVATNYLLGSFDSPGTHDHGKGHHTYGFLDMGGASAQIAFAPNATESDKHANDLTLLRLRNIDGSTQEHRVFVTSWLEFGVREARRRYLAALQSAIGTHNVKEYPDPCLPAGLRTTLDGKSLENESETYLLGTGKFDECLRGTYPLLDKDAPCEDQPCLLHGIHVPAIDFDVNHFVGISEYWHTTHEVFEMGHTDKAYDFNTYQQRVESFCSQDWDAIEQGISEKKWGKKLDRELAYEVCFKASWIINVLHDGIGVPRVGLEPISTSTNGTKELLAHGHNKGYLDSFQAVNKIDSTEVSWTLGKMVLYAASQVPVETEEALPVGFGSNVAGVPGDFQFPSAELLPSPENLHEESWQEALFDGGSSRRIPGFILFVVIIILALFFLCGRGRRLRVYHKVSNLFKRGRGPRLGPQRKRKASAPVKPSFFGTRGPSYERILEEGVQDIELGGSDSSRSSFDPVTDTESTAFLPPQRTSSWGNGSPTRLKFEHDNSSSGTIGLGITTAPISSIDRSGLVVRTESRDNLAPIALAPTTNGRRSRAPSPSRSHPHKSPSTTPLVHD